MTLIDIAAIGSLALLAALATGMLTVAALVLLRRARLTVQLGILAFSGLVSAAAGLLAVDAGHAAPLGLASALIVVGSSGTVTLLMALALGLGVSHGARTVARSVRTLGTEDQAVEAGSPSTAEILELAAELDAAVGRLAAARDRDRAVEHSRREMTAWVTHDLRAPVAGIMAMAEALEDSLADDPARYHRRLRELSVQLAGMVDDLFELSKIDAGTLRLRREPVALVDVVRAAVVDLRASSPLREVALHAPSGDTVMVMADRAELSRAVANLLQNAVQHTPARSPITVSADVRGGRACLSVVDAGAGIDESQLARIFEPGWRGADARASGSSEGSSGAGLGLAIVRGIAEAHRGEVTARNIPGGFRMDLVLPTETVLAAR